MGTAARELDALLSLERIQTVFVGWPPIIRRLGSRSDDRIDAFRVALLDRKVRGLDCYTFACVLGVNGEGASHGAANALLLPKPVTGGRRNIVAIRLIDCIVLATRERLDWAVDFGAVIDAMGIAIDPPFEVDDSVFLMRANVDRFRLQNVGLGGRKHSREDNSLG